MTFLELVNRLRVECGVSGSALVTVAAQTGEYGRLVTWINQAWLDIQNARSDWVWMRSTATFQTASNQPTYSPTTDMGLTNFGFWVNNSFRNYVNPTVTISQASPAVITLQSHLLTVTNQVKFFTTGSLPSGITAGVTYYVQSVLSADTFTISATSGGAAINTTTAGSGTHTMVSTNTTVFIGLRSEIYMSYMDYETWRDTYLYGALRQVTTRPAVVAVAPTDMSIALGPLPITGYTVLGDYYAKATSMSVDADTPAMPEQYHMAIVYKAMQFYGMYEAAAEVLQRGQMEYDRLMRHLLFARTMPAVQGGPLA